MPRRAAVRSRGGPQSRFAPEARVRLRALRSPRPGVVTIACRTRAAQALAKVNRIDGSKSRGFAWPASTKKGESLRRRWFESQSCRVDSLQALLDDLDDLVRADAARARRATRGRAGIVAAAALGGLAAYVVLPLAL